MPPLLLLDPEAFSKACRERGARTHTEIADLLGVHRTTVLRAMERSQQVGPSLMAAIIQTFGSADGLVWIYDADVVTR